MAKSDKLENGRNKRCKYLRSNGHSNEDCYQQKREVKSENLENGRKGWCNYHSSESHSDEDYHDQIKDGKCKDSSTVDNNKKKT